MSRCRAPGESNRLAHRGPHFLPRKVDYICVPGGGASRVEPQFKVQFLLVASFSAASPSSMHTPFPACQKVGCDRSLNLRKTGRHRRLNLCNILNRPRRVVAP